MHFGKAIVIISIGILLIYFGYFGIPTVNPLAPSMAWTTLVSDNFNDNTLDTSIWQTYGDGQTVEAREEIEVTLWSGQKAGGLMTKKSYSLSSAIVVTDIDVGELGLAGIVVSTTNVDPYPDSYAFVKQQTTSTWIVNYRDGNVVTELASGAWAGSTGTLKIEVSGGTVKFYENDLLRYSESWRLTKYQCYYVMRFRSIGMYGMGIGDNFEISSSVEPPPTEKGTLVVQCWVDQVKTPPDSNRIEVVTSFGSLIYYTDSVGYLTVNLDPGSYTVKAWYGGVMDSEAVTITAGQTSTVYLSWGTAPPPPPSDGLDIIEYLNSLTWLRQIEMFAGAIMVCVPTFMMISKTKWPKGGGAPAPS